MRSYTIPRSNAADIKFLGKLVASVNSSNGEKTRWTELFIYRTDSLKLVLVSIGKTTLEHETDITTVEIVPAATAEIDDTGISVIRFFGHGWLAKLLYADAGISDTETI